MAPLAGIALLSAAAAVALNPVLVSISVTGRKKRSVVDERTQEYLDALPAEVTEQMEELKVSLRGHSKLANVNY